jgi:hypothetical protein
MLQWLMAGEKTLRVDRLKSVDGLLNQNLKQAFIEGTTRVVGTIHSFQPDFVLVEDQGALAYEAVGKELQKQREAMPATNTSYLGGAAARDTASIIEKHGGLQNLLTNDDARAQAISEILQSEGVGKVIKALKEDLETQGLLELKPKKAVVVTDVENEALSVLGPIVIHAVFGDEVSVATEWVLNQEAGYSWMGQIMERVFPGLAGLKLMSQESTEDRQFYQATLGFCTALISGKQPTMDGFCWTIENERQVTWLGHETEKSWEEGGYGVPDFLERFCQYFKTDTAKLGQIPQRVKDTIKDIV